MKKCPLPQISGVLSVLLALASVAHAQDTTDAGRIVVGGEGDKPASGLALSPGTNSPRWESIDLFSHKVQLAPVISLRRINRELSDFAPWGASAAYTATALNGGMALAHSIGNKPLVGGVSGLSGSLQLTPDMQVFSSFSKGFKVPGSAEPFAPGGGVPLVGNTGIAGALSPLRTRPETSVALDMGALYKSSLFKASASAFLVKFKDRIASSFEPATATTHNFNIGPSTLRGLEVEAATLPVLGFSAYASATYILGSTDGHLTDAANPLNAFGVVGRFATPFSDSGIAFSVPPKGRAALALQYMSTPLQVNLAGKYTGRRNITVVGDQSLAGFTTFDLNVALQLPPDSLFKSPTLRLDVSNLTNKRFLPANLPNLYGGAPRFTSITLQSDF